MTSKILIADDDFFISQFLEKMLTKQGFQTFLAKDGPETIQIFEQEDPDLILLDIMMPKLNGFEVCQHIRQTNQTVPILMLTAKVQTTDKVLGLTTGADDYITKPFDRHELLARIHTALRRYSALKQQGVHPVIQSQTLEIDGIVVTLDTWKAHFYDEEIDLSKTEFKLLSMFCQQHDKVLDRDFLLKEVWGYEYSGNTRTVDNFVMRLRKKLDKLREKQGHEFPVLETIYGVGYRLKTSQGE